MTENGSSETSNDTRRESDAKALGSCEVCLRFRAHAAVEELGSTLINGELSDGVRNLLEENGDEASVKGSNTLGAQNLCEGANKAGSVLVHSQSALERLLAYLRVGNKADTGRLGRGEKNVGKESECQVQSERCRLTPQWQRLQGK